LLRSSRIPSRNAARSPVDHAICGEATTLWLQNVVPLRAGDTIELQASFRAADGYFAVDHTSL
jgi:hypothetical protein